MCVNRLHACKVTSEEVKMAMTMVNNNIPLAAADTFNSLFKDIFPDYKISKVYASGRTKTARLVNGALKSYFRLKIHICYLPAGSSALGKTVPEVLSTASGRAQDQGHSFSPYGPT